MTFPAVYRTPELVTPVKIYSSKTKPVSQLSPHNWDVSPAMKKHQFTKRKYNDDFSAKKYTSKNLFDIAITIA